MAANSICIGTSGYDYTGWIEAGFYPKETKSANMLPLYARTFPITELNYTWYQIPKRAVLERKLVQVPREFLFTAKLTRTMTHEIDPERWRGELARYRDGLSLLMETEQLKAVLIQFPNFFDRSAGNRKHLAMLLDELADMPLAVEFRHRSWIDDRVFTELSRRKVSLVTVDGPDYPDFFPTLDVVTNPDLLYFRFHGRNAVGWKANNISKKFDYNYSNDEINQLGELINRMASGSRNTFVFFNNYVRGQAPKNAELLINRLVS